MLRQFILSDFDWLTLTTALTGELWVHLKIELESGVGCMYPMTQLTLQATQIGIGTRPMTRSRLEPYPGHTRDPGVTIGQHMPECRLCRIACAGWVDILLHEGLPLDKNYFWHIFTFRTFQAIFKKKRIFIKFYGSCMNLMALLYHRNTRSVGHTKSMTNCCIREN